MVSYVLISIDVFYLSPVGDGRMGHEQEAPFDAIHVGAAAPTVPQAVSLQPWHPRPTTKHFV